MTDPEDGAISVINLATPTHAKVVPYVHNVSFGLLYRRFDVDRFAFGAAKFRNDARPGRRLGIRGHGQWDGLL
jgi:hypothetical protein